MRTSLSRRSALAFGLVAGGIASLAHAADPAPARKFPAVATPAPVYAAPAEENGRLWIARPIMGGLDTSAWDRGERDAKAWRASSFGAFGAQNTNALVEVDGLFDFEASRLVAIDPFNAPQAPDKDRRGNHWGNPYKQARSILNKQIDAARADWLKDHNYTGGVRTFVSDEQIWKPERRTSGLPEPRAIIEIPPEMPRFKSRMQVNATPTPPPHPTLTPTPAIKVVSTTAGARSPEVTAEALIRHGSVGRIVAPPRSATNATGARTPFGVTKVASAAPGAATSADQSTR